MNKKDEDTQVYEGEPDYDRAQHVEGVQDDGEVADDE